MAEPNSFKGGDGTKANQECPQPEIWVQVAAGVLSDEDSLHYLEHAALCPACSAQLKEALEIVGSNTSPPAPIQEALLANHSNKRNKGDSEQTPLPKPMPFHSDADDFSEEAFEEARRRNVPVMLFNPTPPPNFPS